MNYKYCIKEKLEQLPIIEYRSVKNKIIKTLGKTRRTFDRYTTLELHEFSDVPAMDLDIIASYLNCTADDLKNYTVVKSEIRHKIRRKNAS